MEKAEGFSDFEAGELTLEKEPLREFNNSLAEGKVLKRVQHALLVPVPKTKASQERARRRKEKKF